MLLNKMTPNVTEEEIRDLFKSEERRGSYSDDEDLELRPAEMIKMIETTNAEAGQLSVKLTKIWNCFLSSIETEEASDFVNLEKLGEGLDILNQRKSIPVMRKFPGYLTSGKPNLVVTSTEKIHNSCLTLYCHDHTKPLPYIDKVLVCNEKTSAEDVELLCRRAFNDPEGNKIYCVLYSEKLNFDVSMRIENLLINSYIRNRNYRLVFICCQSTALDKYKVEVPEVSRERLRSYIYSKLRTKNSGQDPTSVRLVQSDRPGNGKSRAVQNAAQRLSYSLTSTSVHDLKVDESAIISWLMDHSNSSKPRRRTVYHIDLSSEGAGSSRNDLMFCLGILRGLEDQKGRVWTCDLASDVYMFEKTDPSEKEFATMLPRTFCLSDQESLQNQSMEDVDRSSFAMDTHLALENRPAYQDRSSPSNTVKERQDLRNLSESSLPDLGNENDSERDEALQLPITDEGTEEKKLTSSIVLESVFDDDSISSESSSDEGQILRSPQNRLIETSSDEEEESTEAPRNTQQLINVRKQKTRTYGATSKVEAVDALDDILTESGDEEEQDAIVAQVLDEIGIEVSGKVSAAPSAARVTLGAETISNKNKEADAEIERIEESENFVDVEKPGSPISPSKYPIKKCSVRIKRTEVDEQIDGSHQRPYCHTEHDN